MEAVGKRTTRKRCKHKPMTVKLVLAEQAVPDAMAQAKDRTTELKDRRMVYWPNDCMVTELSAGVEGSLASKRGTGVEDKPRHHRWRVVGEGMMRRAMLAKVNHIETHPDLVPPIVLPNL